MKTILQILYLCAWGLCVSAADEVVTQKFQITVAGSVMTPVHLKVNGTTRVSALLAAAGGTNGDGSARRISIIRCNEPMAYESPKDKPEEPFSIRTITIGKDQDPTVAELAMQPRDQLFFRRKFFIGR